MPDGRIVQRVSFEIRAAEHIPTICLTASQRGEFKLARADDRSFELTLPGYALANASLALPQFPTDDFAGITFVQLRGSPEGVIARIGVDRGIRLGAVWSDNQILLTVR